MKSRSVKPEFATVVDGPDIRIKDPIERTEFDFYSLNEVDPEPASTEPFEFPVDSAVRVRTARLETAKNLNVAIYDQEGDMIKEAANKEEVSVPHGEYLIGLATSEMILYLLVESSTSVKRTNRGVALDFGAEVDVRVGARSFHTRPAAIIDTTEDPADMMKAISMLGSSLKTMSPERSFPASRGHPPLIALDDELRIPDSLERPDTGITIEIPQEYESVFVISPLAFYLGAEVVPGSKPKLITDKGYEKSLTGSDGLQPEVSRILRQAFFLDCVVRTEGNIKIDMIERNEIEPEVNLDFASLYNEPLTKQLQQYLEIPFETIEPHLPRWKTTVDIEPEPKRVEMLSHAVNDLAIVRCPRQSSCDDVKPQPEELAEFYRSASDGEEDLQDSPALINIEPANSIEHVWAGDGFAFNASKANPDAYRRRLELEPKDEIEVDVVCNDPEMIDENVVGDIYGVEETYAFSVRKHEGLTTRKLRELLESPVDFLHYIGHVTTDGIKCPDGMLDVRELDDVRLKMFILNGCRSYVQGNELVRRGSVGGVVTLSKVGNEIACEIGLMLSRLLNNGFPLQSALSVTDDLFLSGNQYAIVGDGSAELVKSEGSAPVLSTVTEDDGSYSVDIRVFSTNGGPSIGALHMSFISDNTSYFLNPGTFQVDGLTGEEIDEYLTNGTFPLCYRDQIYWSNEITVNDLL